MTKYKANLQDTTLSGRINSPSSETWLKDLDVCFAGPATSRWLQYVQPGQARADQRGFGSTSVERIPVEQVKALTSHTCLDLLQVVCHLMSVQQKRYTNSQRNFKLAKINRNSNFRCQSNPRDLLFSVFFPAFFLPAGSDGRTFVVTRPGDSVWFLKCKVQRQQPCPWHKYQYAKPRVTCAACPASSSRIIEWSQVAGKSPSGKTVLVGRMHRNHQQQIGQTTCLGIPATHRRWPQPAQAEGVRELVRAWAWSRGLDLPNCWLIDRIQPVLGAEVLWCSGCGL